MPPPPQTKSLLSGDTCSIDDLSMPCPSSSPLSVEAPLKMEAEGWLEKSQPIPQLTLFRDHQIEEERRGRREREKRVSLWHHQSMEWSAGFFR